MIEINPDLIVYFQWQFITINATIVFTWLVMGLLVLLTWLGTRRISQELTLTRWQNLLETLIIYLRNQISEITLQDPDRLLPFSGSLFLLIAMSNLLDFVPGYFAPTRSLSTTAALALTVFFAVPVYGIAEIGIIGYFKQYAKPTPLMLPFNIIGELSRTLSLAIRLFGNMMSGAMIAAVLISIIPFFVPVVIQLLGLLIGLIQAYVFAVLATVYIGAAMQGSKRQTLIENRGKKGEVRNG